VQTYTTLDGHIVDLAALSDEERGFLNRCAAAYRAGLDSVQFNNTLLNGPENPLLRSADGWVTRPIWEHPLYRAVHDLGDRLGIQQGRLAPEGTWESDPFVERPAASGQRS
jgi:hypothetical protein